MENCLDSSITTRQSHSLITGSEFLYDLIQWSIIARLTYNNKQSLTYSFVLTSLKSAVGTFVQPLCSNDNKFSTAYLETFSTEIFNFSKVFIIYSAGASISHSLNDNGYISKTTVEISKAASAFLLNTIIHYYPDYQDSFFENFISGTLNKTIAELSEPESIQIHYPSFQNEFNA
ncbi:hypothetical protein I862_03775 [endosymbiont of Acanthamoeba sp. UWC8]|uniref:hypothetical protein n=1 Tax=endosymbiont of Acanthamoeba sp. UWC8 TaxID=86106 RepID=UPI0004D0D79F|nr:hypothetical protein [endosymbiont of Acanthamoeba sp. UWC8]AIF81315.1 hypothetical protein I862_03775 [endosymbiont of Acanthamoeba sp. UWC8]